MSRKEFILQLCLIYEEFILETKTQDKKRDFQMFMEWIRYQNYKRFLSQSERQKEK